jgi:hypothetical protein
MTDRNAGSSLLLTHEDIRMMNLASSCLDGAFVVAVGSITHDPVTSRPERPRTPVHALVRSRSFLLEGGS